MAKFRKKPVIIEAMQVPMPDQFYQWGRVWVFLGAKDDWRVNPNKGIDIRTLEGTMTANPGDWIIRGVKGELYPCKADIFAMTYELVEAALVRGERCRVKVRFACTQTLSGKHDVDVPFVDLITSWPPMCCGHVMVPVDAHEWQRISKAISIANIGLVDAGLPDLPTLLQQAQSC